MITGCRILPYGRDGGWSSSHSSYYKFTYKSYHEYQSIILDLDTAEKHLKETTSDLDAEHLSDYIHHKTGILWEESYRTAISIHLFACITIEAFLNHYGVKRLSEKYFKKNMERLGITEKLSLLLLVCHGFLLDKDNSVLKKTRALFDLRNELVKFLVALSSGDLTKPSISSFLCIKTIIVIG